MSLTLWSSNSDAKSCCLEAAADAGIEILLVGFDRNHVHMDIRWVRISLSVDAISKKLKGTTARKLLQEFPGIKKKYFWGSGLWSPTIYADSMGREPEQLRAYIANQGLKTKRYEVTLAKFFHRNTTGLLNQQNQ